MVKFYGLFNFLTNKIITHNFTIILNFYVITTETIKISKMMEEKRKKRQREFDEEPDTSKRMMLTGGTGGTGEGTSETMN